MPLTDDLLRVGEIGTEFLHPLQVYVCEHCYLVQTRHDVDATYYKDYHYSVASSPFAQRFMRGLARALFERYGLKSGDSVVEMAMEREHF